MKLHDLFRKCFAAFQLRCLLVGSINLKPSGLKTIDDPIREWIFGAYNS